MAGLMQIALGLQRAGVIGYYFPNSVIRGMLVGIGLIMMYWKYCSNSGRVPGERRLEVTIIHLDLAATSIGLGH